MPKRREPSKFKINGDIEKIKEIIKIINKSNDISELSILIEQLSNHIENYPKCDVCGHPIYFEHMNFFIKDNYILCNKPAVFVHTFEDKSFNISKCYNCTLNHFKDDMPSKQKYLFMLRYKWAKYIFNIPEEVHSLIRSDMCGITPKTLIRKHGEEEGMKIWEHYCKKQSETNTFEYKQKKYGWTKEQFDEYNRSRAVTLKNLQNKYGKELGREYFNNYVEKQKLTKSWDYMVDKFGEDKARRINQSKAVTLEKMISLYGEEEGYERYEHFINGITEHSPVKYYSEQSQKLFRQLDELLPQFRYESKFFTKNKEYLFEYKDENNNLKTYMLDYFIPSINVCVEYNGDVWHANPQRYKPTDKFISWICDMTAQEKWDEDNLRYERLKTAGIKTIVVWESDFKSSDFDINKLVDEILQTNKSI